MPFQSKAQRAYLFANHPDVAKEFAAETPAGAKLPEHVAKKRRSSPAVEALRQQDKRKKP